MRQEPFTRQAKAIYQQTQRSSKLAGMAGLMQNMGELQPLLGEFLLLTPQQRPDACPGAEIKSRHQLGKLIPQGIINLLFRSGYCALPEAGDGTHFLRRDTRYALRLTQATPFLKTGLNDRLIHCAHLRMQRRAGNKQLYQFGLGDQTQT